MNKMKWSFPSNNHSIRQGISDSGIETFRGNIEASIAREICQNSLDAAIDNKRVLVEFSFFEMDREDFPDKDVFLDALIKSKESWKNQKDQKTFDFLKKAIISITQPSIPFMRVSDFNTTGLTGSDGLDDSNWYNLIKSEGSSDKKSTSGGSFGIGKFAPFAASDLRTVFYSTVDINNLKATQGVAKLVSFKMDELSDDETQGVGFCGNPEKNEKINDCISFDPDFKRSETGTDIFIAGYQKHSNWEFKIIEAVLESFLIAILKGRLEINVGTYFISRETIHDFIKNKFQLISKNKKSILAQYHVYTSEHTQWKEFSYIEENDVKVGILIDNNEADTSRVKMIRKPWMKILDYRPRSGSYLVFSGICLIKGDSLNSLLRKAENPQHVKWEFNRITAENEQKAAKKYHSEIIEDINKQINLIISKDATDESDIEGASDYLPEIDPTGTKKNQIKQPKKPTSTITPQTSIPSSKTASEKLETKETEELVQAGLIDGDEIEINTEHGNGGSSGESIGDTPKGIDDSGDKKILIPQKTGQYQLKLFSPSGSHNQLILIINHQIPYSSLNIEINKIDEDGKSIATKIKSAKNNNEAFRINKNIIQSVPNTEGVIHLEVIFDELIPFSAEVNIYANKK